MSAMIAQIAQTLKRTFGFDAFRPGQEAVVRDVLAGRDVLALMPTGGGKSLCYQAPAVLKNEMTVVVSPLISLMKDQVDSLHACGIPAIQIDSSQSAASSPGSAMAAKRRRSFASEALEMSSRRKISRLLYRE